MIDGGLRKMFHIKLKHFHWQAIESGLMGSGIPDSNYCGDGAHGWIEFKLTRGWTVGLRPEQIGWLLRRTRAGGITFIAIRQQIRTDDVLWLFPGRMARELKESGLKAFPDHPGRWHGGPGRWDWLKINYLLRQKDL